MEKIDSIEILDFDKIDILSIEVTNKIDERYINSFIKTAIDTHNITTTKNSYYFYNFLELDLRYEILVFQKDLNKDIVLIPFIFYGAYYGCDISNTTDIFIYSNHFVVYKNREFLFAKKIDDISKEDIVLYVSQTYNLTIDNISIIKPSQFEHIKANYFKNPDLKEVKFYPLDEDKSFLWFIYFVILIGIIFLYFGYGYIDSRLSIEKVEKPNKRIVLQLEKLHKIKTKHNFKAIDKTIELFKYLKIEGIKLEQIKYIDKKVDLVLSHLNKKKLLDFVTIYDKRIDIRSIKFDKNENIYKMDIRVFYETKR